MTTFFFVMSHIGGRNPIASIHHNVDRIPIFFNIDVFINVRPMFIPTYISVSQNNYRMIPYRVYFIIHMKSNEMVITSNILHLFFGLAAVVGLVRNFLLGSV